MSRSKSLAHYPSRYSEIVMECAVEGKEVKVGCESLKQAASLRGHWYSFIGALRAEDKAVRAALARTATGLPSSSQERVMVLATQSQRVLLTVLAEPPAVLFQNRDSSWQAQLLSKAEVKDGNATMLPKGMDEAQSRLLALQQEMEKKDGQG